MTHIETMKQMVHKMEYILDCLNKDKIPFDEDSFHEALRLGRQAIEQVEKEKAEQEPVYQIKVYGSKTAWHDAGSSAYDLTSPDERRILYTHPQPKAEQTSCYCPNCEALSKKLVDTSPQPQKPLTDAQADAIVKGLLSCPSQISKREFLRTWVRDWAAHNIKE